jgi:hypothetical protein
MIFLLGGHAALKRKDLQTAQQKLSERQRRGIHVKACGNAPGLRKSENISAESAIHLRLTRCENMRIARNLSASSVAERYV